MHYIEPTYLHPANIGRASKSRDLAGDLPIFDIIMNISRSPDLNENLPIYKKKSNVLAQHHVGGAIKWQLYGNEIRFFVFLYVNICILYIATICATEVLFTLQVLLI